MDALVTCGGHGTRLNAPAEKPFVDICGQPTFNRAAAALRDSSVETVRAATSPYTLNTCSCATDLGLDPIEAPGDGYVPDLGFALARVSRPVVIVVSNLPLMAPEHVDAVAPAADGGAVTACAPVELKRDFGASIDGALVFGYEGTAVCPTGLGAVGPAAAGATIDIDADTDTHLAMCLSTGTRLTLNVDHSTSIKLAEGRCE